MESIRQQSKTTTTTTTKRAETRLKKINNLF
jgi:hypothetical protein